MPPADFMDVLLDGLAPDGGLVIPAEIPTVSAEQRESWRNLSYAELAAELVSLYATDIPREDIDRLTTAAYDQSLYADPQIVPLTKLDDRITLVGLSEGPTMAFKDLAMQFLGQVLPYVLEQKGRTLNILGATSGDTGSAAEYAFRGANNINVFMLSPLGRMSDVQRAQMYTLTDPNIHNIAIEGVFDDCQNLVKAINNDAEFKAQYSIGAVNSINFGRICAQIVYYFWAWLRATDELSGADRSQAEFTFAVPSGNFGNIYSGHLARQMGLPIAKLVLATNENNVLDEFFRTGIYTPRSSENTYSTSSPSMDISKASNLERFVRELLGEKDFVTHWSELEADGTLDLSGYRERLSEQYGFVSGTSTHSDRLNTIREVFEATGVVIDPHTADGVAVAYRQDSTATHTLVLETAKPTKFQETVVEALGDRAPEIPREILELLQQPQLTVSLPNAEGPLRDYIAQHIL